jgi:superoxide dismutase, Fe-Mn family
MPITLPPLPYALTALEPYISRETLEFHYGKHHQAYVTNLNNLLTNHPLKDESLEQIIKRSDGPIFNNAAQVWNHSFYWQCLSEKHHQQPGNALLKAIEKDFGSLASFQEQFTKVAIATFGSGWAWLVKDKFGKLSIVSTSNAATPLTSADLKPLLTCDVWEHAYYIDYRNARPKYLEAFWNIVNWSFVETEYAKP